MSRELDCKKPIQTKINPGFGVIRERDRDFFSVFLWCPKINNFKSSRFDEMKTFWP